MQALILLNFITINFKSWKAENISAFAGWWNIWNSGGALSHICTKRVPGATIANNLALLLHTITCRNTIEYFKRLRLFSLSKLHGFAHSYCTLKKHFDEHSSSYLLTSVLSWGSFGYLICSQNCMALLPFICLWNLRFWDYWVHIQPVKLTCHKL